MKPGDLVRFRQELAPNFDYELYDGKMGLIVEILNDKYNDVWARVLIEGGTKLFRTRFFEVIDEAG
jgi:hypothetical protein